MGTILDIILCAIVLCFVIPGFKTGLVRSLVEFIGSIFAIIASIVLANRFVSIVCFYLFNTKSAEFLDYWIAKIITMVVLFVLLQLLVRLLSHTLDTVCKLPVLHQVNSLLGGVFGLLVGALAVFLICTLLQFALPMILEKYPRIPKQEITQSRIYQYVTVNHPIYKLLQVEI